LFRKSSELTNSRSEQLTSGGVYCRTAAHETIKNGEAFIMRSIKVALFTALLVTLLISCRGSAQPNATGQTAQPTTAGTSSPRNSAKVIHVVVALCDNQYQGIVPVPALIGNGDNPAKNLYWGA